MKKKYLLLIVLTSEEVANYEVVYCTNSVRYSH